MLTNGGKNKYPSFVHLFNDISSTPQTKATNSQEQKETVQKVQKPILMQDFQPEMEKPSGTTKEKNQPNKQTNRKESSRCRSEGAKGRERGAVPDVVPCYCCACFLLLVSACCPNRSPFPCVRMSPQNRKFQIPPLVGSTWSVQCCSLLFPMIRHQTSFYVQHILCSIESKNNFKKSKLDI